MAKVALVQHSPWDTRDGGAEETAYGVQCLKYFLRSPLGVPLKPDVIMFNWASHYFTSSPQITPIFNVCRGAPLANLAATSCWA